VLRSLDFAPRKLESCAKQEFWESQDEVATWGDFSSLGKYAEKVKIAGWDIDTKERLSGGSLKAPGMSNVERSVRRVFKST